MKILIGLLNFFLLQWFYVRLVYIIDCCTGKLCGFCVFYNVTPMSGWGWDNYNKNYKQTKPWMFRNGT